MNKHIPSFTYSIFFAAMIAVQAQDKKTERANLSFNSFEYTKAIEQYEHLVQKGDTSAQVYRNLGDANYHNANYEEAAKWYDMFSETTTASIDDVEHLHRYASSLQATKKYDEAAQLLEKLEKQKGIKSDKSVDERIKAIKQQGKNYTIETVSFNSIASDFAPSFRSDGLVFSTGRDTSGVTKNIHNWNSKRFLNLYKVINSKENQFTDATIFSEKLNTKLHESSTAFTKDGMTVYFTRNKEKGGNFGRDANGVSRLKLYKAFYQAGKWGKAEKLPFNIEGKSVAHPSLNKAEDKLYFASDIDGTKGQSDIFVVDINTDGSFGTPKNLGKRINTGGRETFPYVTQDDILYFASDGHPGLGGLDIFAIDLKNIDTSKIVNLGEPLNSVDDDFSFIINANTKKGYFASNRQGGMGDDDIYAFTEKNPVDTKCFSNLTGTVKNKKTGEAIPNATVCLFDENGTSLKEIKSDDMGEFSMPMECNKTNHELTASKQDYDSDRKVIENSKTSAITLLLADKGVPIGTDLAKYLNIAPIYFDLNKSFIRPDAKIILEKILTYMREYPEAKIEVRSHTDSRGSATYNKSLSERRAKETAAYLVEQGIALSKISGKGFGEDQLTNDCGDGTSCSKDMHQQNRRTEFIVVQ